MLVFWNIESIIWVIYVFLFVFMNYVKKLLILILSGVIGGKKKCREI